MTTVCLLGSTGSIGTQALDVIRAVPGTFTVHSLAAARDVDGVERQMREFGVTLAAMSDPRAAAELRERVPGAEVLEGSRGVVDLASEGGADVVLNAVVGAAGLRATLAALDAGRTVALANKESCVAGGPLVRSRLDAGARLVPVDSEHAAVHMCLAGEDPSAVTKLVLTASGGPFRGRTLDEIREATPEQALAHPTWEMGPKITVDSATLMNKGLEVIEAHVLFGIPFDRVEVVVHPQSVVHCLVGFADGSWKASMSPPDMRIPISYALGWPKRPAWGPGDVDWAGMRDLTFEPVDTDAFPCLRLAYEAGRAGGTAPAVLNAANEVAVSAFLDRRLPLGGVADVVERTLHAGAEADLGYGWDGVGLSDVLEADRWARERSEALTRGTSR